MHPLPFPNRHSAGQALAGLLTEYTGDRNTLILALVRGGMIVGRVLADALDLPLHPLVVRKVGHPFHREYAVGAISEGGGVFIDEPALDTSGVSRADLDDVIAEETAELQRRKSAYGIAKRPDLAGKTVILTDDGAATGATMLAAIEDMRKARAGKIIVALPICPPETLQRFKQKADDVRIFATPEPFEAVGKWYEEFPQVEDQEVVDTLKQRKDRLGIRKT